VNSSPVLLRTSWHWTPTSPYQPSCAEVRGSPIREFGALYDARGGYARPIRAAAAVWLSGAAVYLVCEAIAAARLPGYSYVNDYISDLGVYAIMNIGFIVHGSLFLLGAVLVSRACPHTGWACRSFVIAAACNALGNVLVGTFRSGNHWHAVGAGLAIVGGNVAVIIAGLASRRAASVVIGVFGLACLLMPVGVLERGSVYTIIVWELVTAAVLLFRRGRCFPR
jgi:hypothetical membrane protein